MDDDFERIIAEQEERTQRFKLVVDFMDERLNEIKEFMDKNIEAEEAAALSTFYFKGMAASASLLSESKGEGVKEWLEEYKRNSEIRKHLSAPDKNEEEVIDAIISTIDQAPN